jgi:hypothetical protein
LEPRTATEHRGDGTLDQTFAILSVFTSVYTFAWARVSSRADLWYAFTPTDLGKNGKYLDWRDLIRWPLSAMFLVLLPMFYLLIIYAYYFISKSTQSISPLDLKAVDAWKIVQLALFLLPLLGFYNLWQCIMRSLPSTFYNKYALDKIEQLYPASFQRNGGIPKTAFLGLLYIATPLFSMSLLSWLDYF